MQPQRRRLLLFACGAALLLVTARLLSQVGERAVPKAAPSVAASRRQSLESVCAAERCAADWLRLAGGSSRVPAIRHLLWKSRNVSKYFASQLLTWRTLQPRWKVVLWRDRDLEPFVRKYFEGAVWRKFSSLPTKGRAAIMRIDMMRYLLLFKYGGVYADLDYRLVRSLDAFRRLPAVVTREPEAHSAHMFGLRWPLRLLANPAFVMARPGHSFFHFCIDRLTRRPAHSYLYFAGPLGLTDMLEEYRATFGTTSRPDDAVVVPPSFSFYPYRHNRLNSSASGYLPQRVAALRDGCARVLRAAPAPQLVRYCADFNNLDAITNSSHAVYAVHDLDKRFAVYDDPLAAQYSNEMSDIRSVFPDVLFGSDLI